ncbi:DopeyN-terminal domain containing protein, partial [Aphelenchoides avenae]
MVMFCVKTVQLDSHGDIRGRHLARLLETILKTIREKGCDTFSVDNLVSLFVVARRLIVEINQSVSAVESGVDLGEPTTSDRSGSNESQTLTREERLRRQFREDFLEEQRMIERCLTSCCDLLADVCAWYASDRDRNKTGVLCGMSALLRDFADFPLYCFKFAQDNSIADLSASPSHSSLSWPNVASAADFSAYPAWLAGLLGVVDGASWLDLANVRDFDVRARMLDLMLYLYVRSASVQEQHKALVGRQYQSSYDSAEAKQTKTTTTILLKPFLSDGDLTRIENDGVFKESARVLWSSLGEDVEAFNEQTVVCLLCRLHSRRIGETSSDVEEIIVGDLTAPSKVTCCRAAKKFRDLWALTRNVQDGAYAGVPQKPMNRVVMVLLGVLADDSAAMERTELRAIAYAWFIDCARHNDLHRILQILFLMLLNPATARVAIQFVQVQSRITRDQ